MLQGLGNPWDIAPLPAVRYRALTLAPDGALWVATDTGEIWRVVPSPATQ